MQRVLLHIGVNLTLTFRNRGVNLVSERSDGAANSNTLATYCGTNNESLYLER